MGNNRIFYFLVSSILCSAYFISPSVRNKPLPIWAIGILAMTEKNKYAYSVALGMLFSSIGDIMLELDNLNPSKEKFIFGLLSFLVAHVLYIGAFMLSNLSFSQAPWVLMLVGAYYFGIMYVLLPNMEKDLVVPVMVYGGAISTMLFLSIMRFFSTSSCRTGSRVCSLVGSLFFVVSDSILAINKFSYPFPEAHTIIMITYYLGQTFIGASCVRNRRKKKSVE
jgi:uncharacterized membrane protein YhhN